MSSCCGGKCGCGTGCKCGATCTGCKMLPDLSYQGESVSGETILVGLAPEKTYFGGAEIGVGAENGACNCAPNCTCNSCNCK